MAFESGYLAESYRDLNPLITDFYQLTMDKGYFDLKRKDEQATFYMHWRKPPYHDNAGYTTVAGVEGVVDFLKNFKFTEDKINYLRSIKRPNAEGKPERLFPEDFLEYLKTTPLDLDVDAVPEGTVMTGPGPVIRVKGPLIQCQLVESAILQIMNSSSKIATRASRLNDAVDNKHGIADFSLRRSATLDTGVARSAYIGGVIATSNVNSAMKLGIDVTGTMAHSWVTSFQRKGVPNKETELEAFIAYLHSMPNNSTLLVDTYDITQGIKNAIEASIKTGIRLNGIRIDSGKLIDGYKTAKELLTKANADHPELFGKTKVFFTDGLQENSLKNLNDDIRKTGDEYPLPAFGVGTQLGNPGAFDGGVYKLSAHELSAHEARVEKEINEQTAANQYDTVWEPAMKMAGVDPKDPTIPHAKSSLPGVSLDTARMYDEKGKMLGDIIMDHHWENHEVEADPSKINALITGKAISMLDNRSLVTLPKPAKVEFLLKPLFRRAKDASGKTIEANCLYDPPQIEAYEGGPKVTALAPIQHYNRKQREALPEAVKSLDAPERYPMYLDEAVNKTRKDLMAQMVAVNKPEPSESIDVLIDLQPGFSDRTIQQKDGGSLYVPEGEKTIAQAAKLIKHSKGRTFVLSQDFHPANHISFMTNHPGIMEFRKKQLLAMAEPHSDADALSPMTLPFSEIVIGRDGNIIGVKIDNEVHKVELEFASGAKSPSAKDRGRVTKVLDETLDQKFMPDLKSKGAWTQTLWPPHCVQGTKSADFDERLGLPAGLKAAMDNNPQAPDIEYLDPSTGNHFYVIRKGMNSELDSYGIGIENDKRTRTTARSVFEKIADRFMDKMAHKVDINIGGLATNFCMEFSHNNIVDEIIGMFRISGMSAKVNIIHDISRGIPIPGGRDDPFSLAGAFERMKDYNHGETQNVTSTTLLLDRDTPLPEISGAMMMSGVIANQQQRL